MALHTGIHRNLREGELEDPSLLAVCGLAFIVVFALLAFLALAMQAITSLFPAREDALDPVVVAAITTAVAAAIPGSRVVRIEEEA